MASEVKATPAAAGVEPRPWPDELSGLLRSAEQALAKHGPAKALELLSGAKGTSPWLTNARGVCLLRLGKVEDALELFRGLVLGAAGMGLRHEAPTVFKTNYATAQLLSNNLTGCIVTLGQTQDEGHPSVVRLRAGIRRWRQSLSFWEKVRSFLGSEVGKPVQLDFPPGEM